MSLSTSDSTVDTHFKNKYFSLFKQGEIICAVIEQCAPNPCSTQPTRERENFLSNACYGLWKAKATMDFQWIAVWHFGDCTKFAKSPQNLMANHEIEIVIFFGSLNFSEVFQKRSIFELYARDVCDKTRL